MVDNKFTDEQIIEALDWCKQFEDNMMLSNTRGNKVIFALQSIETIKQVLKNYNRQKAEIDELRQNLREAHIDIKEHMAEIEKLTKRQKPTEASGYKIENGKVVFFTNMLGGCRHEYENLDEVVKTLNELLHEAYSKDEILFHYRCAREELKTARAEAIKEFAERFEQKCLKGGIYPVLCKKAKEDTLKEMLEGEKCSEND